MSQQECDDQGCCWVPADFEGAPHVDLPWCFKPNAEPSEYRVAELRAGEAGSLRAHLELTASTQPYLGPDIQVDGAGGQRRGCNCRLAGRGASTVNALPALSLLTCCLTRHQPAHPRCRCAPQRLELETQALSDSVLRMRLTDAGAQRWEVPRWLLASELLPGGGGGAASGGAHAGNPRFDLRMKEDPFSLEVARLGGGATLLNTTSTRLVYKARPRHPAMPLPTLLCAMALQPKLRHSCQGCVDFAPRACCFPPSSRTNTLSSPPGWPRTSSCLAPASAPRPPCTSSEAPALPDPVLAERRTVHTSLVAWRPFPPSASPQAQWHAAHAVEPRPWAHLPRAKHVWQPPVCHGPGAR